MEARISVTSEMAMTSSIILKQVIIIREPMAGLHPATVSLYQELRVYSGFRV